MSQRRQYSAEYKHEAVRWVARSDKSASQLARDLGINPAMVSRGGAANRIKRAHRPSKAFKGHGVPRDEALARLKRALAQVKKERDFSREAAVFFAKASK
ncbi:MAG: transposase [Halothiobacillus sp.]